MAVVVLCVERGQSVHGVYNISLLLVILEARGMCVRFNVVGVPSTIIQVMLTACIPIAVCTVLDAW